MTDINDFPLYMNYWSDVSTTPFVPMLSSWDTQMFSFPVSTSENFWTDKINFNFKLPDWTYFWNNQNNQQNTFNIDFGTNTQKPLFQTPSINLSNPTLSFSSKSDFTSSGMFDTFTPKTNFKIQTADVTDKTQGAVETVRTLDEIDYSIMGASASKVKQLKPEMQKKVYAMFKYAKTKGWTMTITSGYRSRQQQVNLYNSWKAGKHNVPVVAKPGTSRHEFGCAVDINLKCSGVSDKKLYAEMGKFGESIGLRWGGNWRRNREVWHFDINQNQALMA